MTGEIKNQNLERLLGGGIANPIEVVEQITYLLFLRRLDEFQKGMKELGAMR